MLSCRVLIIPHARPIDQAEHVQQAFDAQRDFIQLAASCTKISTASPDYATLLRPTQSALMAVVDVKEKNRPSKEINQLSTISEGIPALGWVTLVSFLAPSQDSCCQTADHCIRRTGQQTWTLRWRYEGKCAILCESSSEGSQGIVRTLS